MSSNDDKSDVIDRLSEARRRMVAQQIAARGIRDAPILAAMERLPRDRFVPSAQRDEAYADQALPIGSGQTISQPYMVAYMTEFLNLEPGHKVLEVGTGSGYQTALLVLLGGRVHTIERLPEFAEAAERRLSELDLAGATFHVGDGSLGLPCEAPFDRILVTAASPDVPQPLIEQLALGGRLVAPVGGPDSQVVVRVDRLPGRTIETPGLACRFVRLLGERGWPVDGPEAAPEL